MPKKVKINITGMTCVNCANAVIKGTKKIKGVKGATINLADNSGIFELENESLVSDVKSKIKKLGFGVVNDYEELERAEKAQSTVLLRKLILAAILSVIIMFCEMSFSSTFNLKIFLFLLATIVIAYSGSDFFKHAIFSLKNRNYDMNVLVLLGSGSAYLYSIFVMIAPNLLPENMRYLYFSGPAMIITFILLGKYLEQNSKQKAKSHFKQLIDLTPKKAWLVSKTGQSKEIPANELKIGDIIEVKSGYNIAGDGVIINGGAEVNESAINGESLPVYKGEGDEVFAGSLNTNGYINVKITAEPNQTLLAQILDLLLDAGAKKMPIARLADRAANIFVPAVVTIAILTFIVWSFFDFQRGIIAAICVLIISCPCALGLATPIAIVSGLSKGAKNGILIKNPQILELVNDIKYVIFDKTGTLTTGKISVINSNLNQEELELIANLEKLSSHPISNAICNFVKDCKEMNLEKSKFKNLPGRGIIYNDGEILVGNSSLLKENNIDFKENEACLNGIVYIAINGNYRGFIEFSDTIKENAKDVVEKLANQGIEAIMLTGDREQTAKMVGEEIGIKTIISEVIPTQKLEIIQKYQEKSKVIFVGDGINDALSLKAADIGIAMSSGSDIAKDVGDVILIRNDLNSVLNTVTLSKATMKTIKENLTWAFLYNAICIPVAAGVLYPMLGLMLTPMYGAAAMSISSVSVVLNSLRLRFVRLF